MKPEPKLVGIAQLVIARAPEQLCCLGLGSCVAVFLYDPITKLGGIVHILLPRAPANCEREEKYADTGIRKLVRDMLARGAKRETLRAKLVGGAQMFPNLNVNVHDIGKENCDAVKRILRDLRIRISAEDIEGTRGRSATYNLDDGHVSIKMAFGPEKTI